MSSDEVKKEKPPKWSLGVLNDKLTNEVPGSILLMPKEINHNEPLGLRNAPARTSASSLPSPYAAGVDSRSTTSHSRSHSPSARSSHSGRGGLLSPPKHSAKSQVQEKKRTPDGQIILDPQPEDSLNDPLNWASWRRDVALLSLGFYCMIGGGMTPILAAGFTDVADTYKISVPQVALTTGLYMMGMGVGSVVASPTAILFGKRPVYLIGAVLFILSSIWCAVSPNYTSLLLARIFQGISLSPVECLPSATIAEIFFLHERAYRLGVYTLLLLGGKNLIPLVSAVIIQALQWRWVFWIVAIVGVLALGLLFFFVPETFWDRTSRPKSRHHDAKHGLLSNLGHLLSPNHNKDYVPAIEAYAAKSTSEMEKSASTDMVMSKGPRTIAQRRQQKSSQHVGFADSTIIIHEPSESPSNDSNEKTSNAPSPGVYGAVTPARVTHLRVPGSEPNLAQESSGPQPLQLHRDAWRVEPNGQGPKTPALHNFNSPSYQSLDGPEAAKPAQSHDLESQSSSRSSTAVPTLDMKHESDSESVYSTQMANYTANLRASPPKTFFETLKPWNGRLRKDKWLHVAIRPFILFAYPAILWSTLVYSLSVGWLIVLSESVAHIYRDSHSYNFTAFQTGLVYLSPFVGGVLGTAVAGKVSDLIVRFMARRNDGVYEPEFRLLMALPVMITTCAGLMGFGWSAEERDMWAVPTVFFGVISFGCSLGSTTAITFAVDSYRQYAGEALVTLNFSKNIFHGLVFSLFFPHWLEASGAKNVFLAIGGIQIACLLTTIPMYVYGKRARMWTFRKNMMEKF